MACDDGAPVVELCEKETCPEPSCDSPIATSITLSPSCDCSCGCTPCQCGGVGTPYYNQAQSCQESHVQVYSNLSYVAAVSNGKSFNMPACDVSVVVEFPGLIKIQSGSYLWSTSFGYLKVLSFNSATGEITLLNECQFSNAPGGVRIPACTLWTVVDPPYELGDDCPGDHVYVTEDFIAPVYGDSVTVQVNTITGLTMGQDVQVGVAVYSLTAILTANSIIIQNNGGIGIVPGDTIYAKDSDGNCLVPVTPIFGDPCDATAVDVGELVVCSGAGTTTLNAYRAGQIPVCVDASTNEVEFQDLDVPLRLCTELTACLTLVSGTDNYTIFVADTTGFIVGQIIVIQHPDVDDLFFEITNIVPTTRLDITCTTANVYDGTIDAGIQICEAYCCDQLQYDLEHLGSHICDQDWSEAFALVTMTDMLAGEGQDILPGATFTSATQTVTFENNTCNTMQIMVHVEYFFRGTFETNEMSWARMKQEAFFGYTTDPIPPGAPAVPVPTLIDFQTEDINFGAGPGVACDLYNSHFSKQYTHVRVISLAPNTAIRIDAYQKLSYLNYVKGEDACCACVGLGVPGSGTFTMVESAVKLHTLGISIHGAP